MPALFVNHLTVIDFSFVDSERGIVGESWIVDVTLHGELDEQGMVFDFGHVKKSLKNAIDEAFDHRLWLPNSLTGFQQQPSKDGSATTLSWHGAQARHYTLTTPMQGIVLMQCERITIEQVTPFIKAHLLTQVPDNVAAIELQLRPEAIDGVYYHYSHGLKKHDGNCQRIAHGHRSTLEIYRNDSRDSALEAAWAKRWQDIYIGSESDLKDTFTQNDITYYHFGYQAQQGAFELSLPAEQCYLIDTDSTVELLAQHIAMQIQQEHPHDRIRVHAFEGVWKGAIATLA